jgi:hypothetical protein
VRESWRVYSDVDKMSKVHKFYPHGDEEHLSSIGQSKHEYDHSTICGYVRDNITVHDNEVTCKLCLREMGRPRPSWEERL